MEREKLLALIGVVALASAGTAANGALLHEDFESGQHGWLVADGTWQGTAAAPASPKGLSYEVPGGEKSRIYRTFDRAGLDVLTISFDFQDNTASPKTQRHFGGLQHVSGGSLLDDPGLMRIGADNTNSYVFEYFTTALQTVDTGVALAPARTWHHAEITATLSTQTIQWKLDGASGIVSDPNLTAANFPTAAVLGFNHNNGANGKGTHAFFDNLFVMPEPPMLIVLGVSGALWGLRCSRRRTSGV